MSETQNGKILNSRFDLVILNKVDKEGNYTLLHQKPLTAEVYNQIPDSLLIFSTGKLLSLFSL